MAKRKRNSGNEASVPTGSGSSSERCSASIESAENGFTIRISNEGKNGYSSKQFVAPNGRAAMRIAASHLGGASKAKHGKKSSKKKISNKTL